MQANLVPRRTQFSSCDACRKSRVACDAMRLRGGTTYVNGQDACSRCANRGKECTFEWMKRGANRTSHRPSSRDRPAASPTIASVGKMVDPQIVQEQSPTSNSVSERTDDNISDGEWQGSSASSVTTPVTSDVAEWLQSMYKEGFEAVFGSWLGNYSCPYVFGEHGPKDGDLREQGPLALCVSISSICTQFDQWMKGLEIQGSGIMNERPRSPTEVRKEQQIDRTLKQAMQTYSARWLPLSHPSALFKPNQAQLIEQLWRDLRRELLKVINRPCYRSMLTLFLFALTPIPIGISEEEEGDGISAQFCVQAALQQVQHLRARQRSLEFNGSKVSPLPEPAIIASSPDNITADFIDIESILYWAALTFDTSYSLTLNTKSILSSGLLGWESESSWRLVTTCTNMFHEQTEDWRTQGLDVNEDNANRIVAAASTWKLRVWKVGAVLKEALREGQEEDAVQRAFAQAVDAIDQFNVTYRVLMMACERNIQFLSQLTKLRWYETMLHYHLCILIVIDAIEIARRTDLLEQMKIIRTDAEGSVINCLAFGLNNQFSIPRRVDDAQDFVTVPLVAIDPYTHHVVAAVQLMWKATERNLEAGKLSQSTFDNLSSMMLRTLEFLPQTSKSVQNAKQKLQNCTIAYRQGQRNPR